MCRLLYYVLNIDCNEFMWHNSVLGADLFFIIFAESGVFVQILSRKFICYILPGFEFATPQSWSIHFTTVLHSHSKFIPMSGKVFHFAYGNLRFCLFFVVIIEPHYRSITGFYQQFFFITRVILILQ